MASETCTTCVNNIDADGNWLGECAARGMPDQCEDCHGCICDGSC